MSYMFDNDFIYYISKVRFGAFFSSKTGLRLFT